MIGSISESGCFLNYTSLTNKILITIYFFIKSANLFKIEYIMNSKNRNGNTNDNQESSSISKSPYNLRRNQVQPGAIIKRSSSAKSRKDISVIVSQTSNQSSSSSTTEGSSIRDSSIPISL
jgi:hypothetical protein